MTACGTSLPAVPGLSGATWYPVSWTADPRHGCGRWFAESFSRFERLAGQWGDRVRPLVGDLTELELSERTIAELGDIDHVLHCAAVHDTTWADATRAVIELAARLDATFHHVSSIAVAGDFAGHYTEADFDVGQRLPTPYHRMTFEAERLVRSTPGLRYRIYRPAVVVGDSRTGEMDTIDGPYYLFGVLAKLAVLPSFTPMLLPDIGRTNIVPVDYVADALVALMHADGRDGQTFHLTAPTAIGLRGIYRGIAGAAGLPPLLGTLPGFVAAPVLNRARPRQGAAHWRPPNWEFPPRFSTSSAARPRSRPTQPGKRCAAPAFTSPNSPPTRPGCGGIGPSTSTPTARVATIRCWAATSSYRSSSAIGRASAIAVAKRGATVFALARNGNALDELVTEIRAHGGQAHAFTCDVTDSASVEHTVKDILGRFDHVDYLVNNAGRSIRRSVVNSTDRLHDYERVMAVNYFGAVRMVLALLPHWRERRFGHVVNVSSAGVQARNPKYSSYLPTKAALDAFADVVAQPFDHITFTNIHMPLVATPMIVPSRRLNPVRAISAERGGDGDPRTRGKAGAHRHSVGYARRSRNTLSPRLSPSSPALSGLSRFSCSAGDFASRRGPPTGAAASPAIRPRGSPEAAQALGATGARCALVVTSGR
ncbi:short chain dehydrogenase [Mycobacterium tuberculosis CAS/NITR204]|uniref:Short chain dehydrogenase n=1 Tax=Mycobacterium tuberculosis CAS/NITR204 TaxID=1310114 RepID=R4MIW0_MYCTX|nr:short chain dehydrogenase [Mycobacterium tuberculosis CAS/NITR204]